MRFVVAMVTLSVPQALTFSHDTLHLGWGLACQRDFICLILIYFLPLASGYLFPKLHATHPSLPHSEGWGIFSDVLIKLQSYADVSLGHGGMTFSVFLSSEMPEWKLEIKTGKNFGVFFFLYQCAIQTLLSFQGTS